jgi:hypothetical protein
MEWYQVLATILGNGAIFLPIFFWLRSEANADRRDLANILIEMKNEMADFHKKLALQDQEFKLHMIYNHKEKN